jgi:hypothetical protein
MKRKLSTEQIAMIEQLDKLKARIPAHRDEIRRTIDGMKDMVVRFNHAPNQSVIARFEGIAFIAAIDKDDKSEEDL